MIRKPLSEQTIVVTGASSGIGLSTVRLAVERGARVVACSRDGDTLGEILQTINGDQAYGIKADVRSIEDMQRLADETVKRFGGIDTWVNNAGVSIYGEITKVPLEDHRALFETNYWGVVHGSLAAVPYLREREGTLINVGSTFSDRAAMLQGPYSASKHAVKAFTDALRMELEHQRSGIAVCLVKPGAINTPYSEHAKNFLDKEPINPPPYYAPEVAAEAILHLAEHPQRDLFVGASGKLVSLMSLIPCTADRLMEKTMSRLQQSNKPRQEARNVGLHEASGEGRESGDASGPVLQSSIYTKASSHRYLTAAGLAAAGLVAGKSLRRRSVNE